MIELRMHMSLPCRRLTGDVCTSFDLEACVCAGRFRGNCEEFARDIAPGIVSENEDVFKHKKIIG